MMHTTKAGKFLFHHNGDFSGKVLIKNTDSAESMAVDFDSLKSLVAEWVRNETIAQIEQLEDDQLLLG